MESGIHRATYTRPKQDSEESLTTISNHAIRGVATDGLNQVSRLLIFFFFKFINLY